jgi:hypothetical protein
LDPLLETDWAEHWKQLVAARHDQAWQFHDPAFWDKRARIFAAATGGRKDGFLDMLEPWLQPQRTLTDVGAGAGRYAAPLADRLDWVTAVEPSQGMRDLIPEKANMTVIATDWEHAEPAPADLLICCHVLYGVSDAPGFIAKLEAAATERVFIQLRFGQLQTASDPIWELMTGGPRARQPEFADLWNLLSQMGIAAEVAVLEYEGFESWPDAATFEAEYRPSLADTWDEAKAAAWLGENTTSDKEGKLIYSPGRRVAGVAHWRPRR